MCEGNFPSKIRCALASSGFSIGSLSSFHVSSSSPKKTTLFRRQQQQPDLWRLQQPSSSPVRCFSRSSPNVDRRLDYRFFLLLAASDDDESAHRRISPALKILIAFPFAQHNRERFTHHVERELSSFRGWLDKGGRVLLSSLYFFA